ncbi:hypothetical protein PHLCEN_2v12737 [Hermanssonia centrifuga]|uniref:Uncharacterized protein n=1 Tax=Hermanssonia centrifuga TaxID=98765 RepID=A0A2R6NGA8_9APHY|nr:hypothetical protein PHLCEN_2v12737 [Hermanssonia centrifuga]
MAPASSKPEVVPPSASSEPSEPSGITPGDKPKEQITGEQGENPQVTVHKKGMRAADERKSGQERDSEGDGKALDNVAKDGFTGGGKEATVKPRL